MSLLHPQREVRNKVPRILANNREITGPNQLWQVDIKYGYIAGTRRHFYLASAIDVYDRAIVGHYTGKVCAAEDITQMLNKAMLKRSVFTEEHLLVIRTDNGPQFCSKKFHTFCTTLKETKQIEHERIPVCSPNKNAYIESFHSILERECYQRHIFETFEQAVKEVNRFIGFYNERRYHGSLNDYSPMEYLQKFRNGEIKAQKIAL